ncbi:MAG: hypothetical protein KF688_16800 [Pirellulales bacterium]|nr:hypothetical protein [Pirellulales bacterium]
MVSKTLRGRDKAGIVRSISREIPVENGPPHRVEQILPAARFACACDAIARRARAATGREFCSPAASFASKTSRPATAVPARKMLTPNKFGKPSPAPQPGVLHEIMMEFCSPAKWQRVLGAPPPEIRAPKNREVLLLAKRIGAP